MEWNYFIGIDVSKLTLDFCVNRGKDKVFSTVVDNRPKALDRFWKELCKKFPDFNAPYVLCCFEHTGIYNEHLLSFLAGKKVSISVENPTHIKLSGGLTRGKNDKVDAERIANYAFKERDTIKLWKPTRDVIKTLKHLSVLRVRLIGVRKSLSVPQTEIKMFDKQASKMMAKLCKSTLTSVEKDLEGVDTKIKEIVDQDERLRNLFKITTSVVGIGPVTAVELLITTNEFKGIRTASQYACYAGIAPFDHQSGTSLKTKPRVSHRANKRVKTLLHMAAMTSTTHAGEMRDYMLRKVEEGKSKMSILNAIRNKIVHRVFSCITGDRMYEKEHQVFGKFSDIIKN